MWISLRGLALEVMVEPIDATGSSPVEASPTGPAPTGPAASAPPAKIKATGLTMVLRVLFVFAYIALVLVVQLPWLWTTIAFAVVATAIECFSFTAPNFFFRKEWPGWYDPDAAS